MKNNSLFVHQYNAELRQSKTLRSLHRAHPKNPKFMLGTAAVIGVIAYLKGGGTPPAAAGAMGMLLDKIDLSLSSLKTSALIPQAHTALRH